MTVALGCLHEEIKIVSISDDSAAVKSQIIFMIENLKKQKKANKIVSPSQQDFCQHCLSLQESAKDSNSSSNLNRGNLI